MLYDHKRWDKPKAAPSMEGLVAWLETMPAHGRYDYNNERGDCAIGQYMASIGVTWIDCGNEPNLVFCLRAFINVAHAQPWTFGAALERARTVASGRFY